MQAAVILGGGFYPDGKLTELSRQRLDAGIKLSKDGKANRLVVLGASKSTYLPNAIDFDLPGAEKRASYLIEAGIPENNICKILNGRDTIGEAIACKKYLPQFDITDFFLITSAIHMPRAEWIFQNVLGSLYHIQPHEVDCGGILLADEEADYLSATQAYFRDKTETAFNLSFWHDKNSSLYENFKKIHDRYHPPGKESQAYFAVIKDK